VPSQPHTIILTVSIVVSLISQTTHKSRQTVFILVCATIEENGPANAGQGRIPLFASTKPTYLKNRLRQLITCGQFCTTFLISQWLKS